MINPSLISSRAADTWSRSRNLVRAIPLILASALSASIGAPVTNLAEEGRILFARNCAHCHGDDARGDEGPSLYELHKTDARIRQIIQQGIKGEMPKFLAKFNDTELQALLAYLRTLKD